MARTLVQGFAKNIANGDVLEADLKISTSVIKNKMSTHAAAAGTSNYANAQQGK